MECRFKHLNNCKLCTFKKRKKGKLSKKKKQARNKRRLVTEEVEDFSEQKNESSKVDVGKSAPLRGGALLFRNRADRTMILKDKIDYLVECYILYK